MLRESHEQRLKPSQSAIGQHPDGPGNAPLFRNLDLLLHDLTLLPFALTIQDISFYLDVKISKLCWSLYMRHASSPFFSPRRVQTFSAAAKI